MASKPKKRAAETLSPTEGIYYLSRVTKMGTLTDDGILKAISQPASVTASQNSWSIIEGVQLKSKDKSYGFGLLAKYRPQGTVETIDTEKHQRVSQEEPNLLLASCPFVYLPEFAGIAYLHVSNEIERATFEKRFAEIVVETHRRFFTDCNIEPVADLEGFIAKIVRLDGISQIEASVQPPNPLFGPLWGDLKDYLEKRNAEMLTIKETAPKGRDLNTNLVESLKAVKAEAPIQADGRVLTDISDAAMLMAVDGYGTGKVVGRTRNRRVVIKTDSTIKNFTFDRDPTPEELYTKAVEAFQGINDERQLRH